MPTLKQANFASMLVFALLSTAVAQESPTAQRSSLTITANAVEDRVRITAPSSVVQMRVEVYAASGEKLFDQEIRGGNVFDWHLQDGQAQRLAPGDYVCVVTAKSISGRLTQRIGTVNVAEKSASVQSAESKQLSAPQAQTIGPVEENASWTIAAKDEPQTGTVIANDGTDGQMIRGRGALTFRIGDFFSGEDKEQMRLTEAGNLGIGTSEPKATLDVAGTIRAQRFLVARPKLADGNKLSTDSMATDAVDSVQPLIAGTGTQNRIAKWTDNAATLGDSSITDTGGNVGIGTTTPGSKLVVSSNAATLPAATGIARFADADGVQTAVFADAFGTNPILNVRRANGTAAVPSAVQANQLLGVIGASGYGASAYMGTRARVAFWASQNWTNTANGTYLTFNTTANGAATAGGTERMRIDNAGNVGIGTTAPEAKLDIRHQGAGVNSLMITETGTFPQVIGRSSNGTLAAPTAITSGSALLSLSGRGHTSAGFSSDRVRIDMVTTENWTNSANGTRMLFATTANGTTSEVTRVTIEQDGGVGIGTTAPEAKLDIRQQGLGIGVKAVSDNTAVYAESTSGRGVLGISLDGWGVNGFSENSVAVVAISRVGNLVEGYVGGIVGPIARQFHITNDGTYVAGSDFAEALPALGDKTAYEPGDVLVVSTKAPGKVEKSSHPYDPRVAGIYSTRPGMLGADKNGTSRVDADEVPVAIVGIVPTKVSATNGSIRVGDLLTTSSTPGHAMRCTNRAKCVGAIVGKAMEPLTEGQGAIKVLVMLR